MASHYTGLSYLHDTPGEVSSGNRYRFRVAGRSKYGWGAYSTVAEILAAVVPDTPLTVVTAQNALNTQITWQAPEGNGSDIESYDVQIQGSSGFSASVTCPASDPDLTDCLVAYTELRESDFNLILGDLILA